MKIGKVDYVDDDNIPVSFLSLVLRVDSINKLFPGGLNSFLENEGLKINFEIKNNI